MKTIAILVLIAFVLLPLVITVFSVIAKSSAKRHKASTKPPLAIPLILGQTKSRRRLHYLVGSFYGVGLLAAVSFFILEVIAPAFNLPQKGIIFVGIFMLIMLLASSIPVFLLLRHFFKINPVPEEGFTAKSRIEWENKFADIYLKNIGRMLLYTIGFFLFASAIFMLIFYYFG